MFVLVLKIMACWVILKPCVIDNNVSYVSKSIELVLAVKKLSPTPHTTPNRKHTPSCFCPYLNNPTLVHGT